jgi:ribosomal protein S18 acetylase RimI-like enzyme
MKPDPGEAGAADDIRIRDARAAERAEIRELTMGAYAQYAEVMAPSAWAGLERALLAALGTEEEAERIVAERAGRLVGSVMLFPPESRAYTGVAGGAAIPELRLLAVAEEARGEGIGEALVRECANRARRMGAAGLGLHTSESMRAAIRMYRRMGFARDPEQDFQPPGAELVQAFRLELGPG